MGSISHESEMVQVFVSCGTREAGLSENWAFFNLAERRKLQLSQGCYRLTSISLRAAPPPPGRTACILGVTTFEYEQRVRGYRAAPHQSFVHEAEKEEADRERKHEKLNVNFFSRMRRTVWPYVPALLCTRPTQATTFSWCSR